MATAGNILGDKTNLLSNRKVKEITGNPGEGASEMETTHSPEGHQRAARGYRENHQKYKKMPRPSSTTSPSPSAIARPSASTSSCPPPERRPGRLGHGRPGPRPRPTSK